jgi:hypothetical protein
VGVAFVYFDYYMEKDPLNTTETRTKLVASILSQLLSHLTPLPEEVKSAYEGSIKRDFNRDFKSLLGLIQSVTPYLTSAYVLFDAFDESDLRDREDVLFLIRQLSQWSVKVFVTSRPHLQATQDLSLIASICSISANELDIRKYLSTILSGGRLAQGIKTKIIEELSSRAKGMYVPFLSVNR